MAKQLQPGGAVGLVACSTIVEHRCRRSARAADGVAKGVIEYRVCDCTASGNAACTALGIGMVGVVGTAALFAQARSVGSVGVL